MSQRTKLLSFPSRHERGGEADRRRFAGRGYAFLILMMALTILLISLTTALPDIYTANQREREEELIFRGNEYARAIMLYRRQFNRFPSTVDDLVKKTNGFRFLRHAYKDPMTKSGKWRFIHANAGGGVLDSKTLPSAQRTNPLKNSDSGKEENTKGPSSENSQTADQPEKPEKSEAAQSPGDETQGAFIVGVASTSKKKSVRIWNNHSRYDEWEFLGVTSAPTGAAGAQPGTPSNDQPQGTGTPTMQPRSTSPGDATVRLGFFQSPAHCPPVTSKTCPET